MMAFKDIVKKSEDNITGNNIKPEFNEMMIMSRNTKGSERKYFHYFSGTKKELDKILYGKKK